MFLKELKRVHQTLPCAASAISYLQHSFKRRSSSGQKATPRYGSKSTNHTQRGQIEYNYGLTGKGKSKRLNMNVSTTQGEVIFGLHPVYVALKAGRRTKVHALYINNKFVETEHKNATINKILELVLHNKIPVQPASTSLLDQLAGNRPHQGVCLDVDELDLPDLTEETEICRSSKGLPLWLLLHNIQDPMNLGAILRTAHYLGLDKVVIPSSGSCRLSPVVSKASAGAMEIIDLVRLPQGTSEVMLCEWWQSRGWEVIGTAIDGEAVGSHNRPVSLYEFSATRPSLVLLGNEGTGLSPNLLKSCDTLVTIPSHEGSHSPLPIGSLNVSVAAGILLHWIRVSSLRQT